MIFAAVEKPLKRQRKLGLGSSLSSSVVSVSSKTGGNSLIPGSCFTITSFSPRGNQIFVVGLGPARFNISRKFKRVHGRLLECVLRLNGISTVCPL